MTIKEQLMAKKIDLGEKTQRKENIIEQLFNSINDRDYIMIQSILETDFDVNSYDSSGYTALMVAVEKNDVRACKLLVENGADLNCKDEDGQTLLMKAAFVNAKEVAVFLIKKNANVNDIDKFGQTPLMFAAQTNSKEVGELLLLNGAIIETTDFDGKTARDIAIEYQTKMKNNDFFLRMPIDLENLMFNKVKSILESLINNKIPRVITTIFEIKDKYFSKCIIEINENYINNVIKVLNEKYSNILQLRCCNEKIVIVPDEKELEKFCKKMFNGIKIGDIITLEDLNNKCLKQYGIEQNFLLEKFLEVAKQYIKTNDLDLNILIECDKLIFIPNEKEFERFCIKNLQSINFGDIITSEDLNNKYAQQYGIESKYLLEKFLEVANRYVKTSNLNLNILSDCDKLIFIPDEKEIENFCIKTLKDIKIGYIIGLEDLNNKYLQKYSVESENLLEKFLEVAEQYVITNNVNFKILRDNNKLIFIPNEIELEKFCKIILEDIKIGDIITEEKLYDRYNQQYGIESNKIFEKFLKIFQQFIKESQNSFRIRSYDNDYIKLPNVQLMNDFFKNNILNWKFYSFKELYNTFIKTFNIVKEAIVISDWVSNDLQRYIEESKSLERKEINGYEIIIEKEIRLANLFNLNYPCVFTTNEIASVYDEFDILNKYFEENGLIIRKKTSDNTLYILTINSDLQIINEIVKYLKSMYQTEDIGAKITFNSIYEYMKTQYDISIDNVKFIESAIEIANIELINKIFKIEKKLGYIILETRNIKEIELNGYCPACNYKFDTNLLALRDHILLEHTNSRYSILYKMQENLYLCRNCQNQNLQLETLRPQETIRHIIGKCNEEGVGYIRL